MALIGASSSFWTVKNHDFDSFLFDAFSNEDIRELGWVLDYSNFEMLAKYGFSSVALDHVRMFLRLGDTVLEVGA